MSKGSGWKHSGRIIRAEIRTAVDPERLWAAWTDPEKLCQWFPDKATGDARPGGTIAWIFEEDCGYVFPQRVLEAVAPQRLLLQGEFPTVLPPITEITIEREGGQTVLKLVNSGFDENAAWDDEFEGTVSGWQLALAGLKHYVENYYGEPKRSIHLMRPAEFSYQRLLPLFLEAKGRAQWLTTAGGIGRSGDPCALTLRGGQGLSGRVLGITAREVARCSAAHQEHRG